MRNTHIDISHIQIRLAIRADFFHDIVLRCHCCVEEIFFAIFFCFLHFHFSSRSILASFSPRHFLRWFCWDTLTLVIEAAATLNRCSVIELLPGCAHCFLRHYFSFQPAAIDRHFLTFSFHALPLALYRLMPLIFLQPGFLQLSPPAGIVDTEASHFGRAFSRCHIHELWGWLQAWGWTGCFRDCFLHTGPMPSHARPCLSFPPGHSLLSQSEKPA